MNQLRDSSKSGIGYIVRGVFAMLLISVMLGLSLQSCARLKGDVKTEEIPPKVMLVNGIEYWCLEKKDFTAILQEADRSR